MEAAGLKERPGQGDTGPQMAFKATVLDVTAWGVRTEISETCPEKGLEDPHLWRRTATETESEHPGRQEVGKRATEGVSRKQELITGAAAGRPGKAGEWKPVCSGLKKEFGLCM